jgi:hypothetical protein
MRAYFKLSLPQPHGCALFRVVDQAPSAWLLSIAACLSDQSLFDLRDGLAKYVPFAYQKLQEGLGGKESEYWQGVQHLLPESPEDFLSGTLYGPDIPLKAGTSRLIMRNVGKSKVDLFQKITGPDRFSTSLNISDIIAASSISEATRIFSEPFHSAKLPFNISHQEYIAWTRFFLGLPPPITIGGAEEVVTLDYKAQRCQSDHGVHVPPYLDANADHASSNCPSTYLARNKKHALFVRVLVKAAQDAGLKTRCEPDSHTLLLGEFSKPDCRRLFPRRPSKQYKVAFEKMVRVSAEVNAPECKLSMEEKSNLLRKALDEVPPLPSTDTTGLRIDIAIENPATGETKWVDVTGVHTTSTSYQDAELPAVLSRRDAVVKARRARTKEPLALDPSPTILQREKSKMEKYSRLMLLARKQTEEGKRRIMPTFHPVVCSDFGELGPAAIQLQEWIVGAYRRRIANDPRTNGISDEQMTKDFRNGIKTGMQFAVAAGLGAMILAAGRPKGFY